MNKWQDLTDLEVNKGECASAHTLSTRWLTSICDGRELGHAVGLLLVRIFLYLNVRLRLIFVIAENS